MAGLVGRSGFWGWTGSISIEDVRLLAAPAGPVAA